MTHKSVEKARFFLVEFTNIRDLSLDYGQNLSWEIKMFYWLPTIKSGDSSSIVADIEN